MMGEKDDERERARETQGREKATKMREKKWVKREERETDS